MTDFSDQFRKIRMRNKRISYNLNVMRQPACLVLLTQSRLMAMLDKLIRFARVCSYVDDFITRNKCLTAKLLKKGYRYHKLRKAFF